jgi:hypothetical protein
MAGRHEEKFVCLQKLAPGLTRVLCLPEWDLGTQEQAWKQRSGDEVTPPDLELRGRFWNAGKEVKGKGGCEGCL